MNVCTGTECTCAVGRPANNGRQQQCTPCRVGERTGDNGDSIAVHLHEYNLDHTMSASVRADTAEPHLWLLLHLQSAVESTTYVGRLQCDYYKGVVPVW